MFDIKKLRGKNTKKTSFLEFLVYPEKGKYVGICLTLDIVEEGKNPKKLIDSITESAMGHVMLVVKKGLDDSLLNRPAPEEYWKKYFKALEELGRKNRKKKLSKTGTPFTLQLPLTPEMVSAQ